MHKIPSSARFIVAGKKCINKQLSKHVTSSFKLCNNQIDAYHKKRRFSEAKTFWVIQNISLPLECINKINKNNAKQISALDFMFKGGTRDYIIINKQGFASW